MPNPVQIKITGDATLQKNVEQAEKIHQSIKNAVAEWKKLSKKTPFADSGKVIEDLKGKTTALTTVEQERLKILKQLNTLTAKSGKENEKLQRSLLKARIQQQEKTKATKLEIKEQLGLIGPYSKISNKLNDLRKRYKDVAISQGINSKAAKRLRIETIALDKRLKRIDANVGQFQRSVGNYGKAFGSLTRILGAVGFTGGVFALVNIVKGAVKIFVNFEKATSGLSAILQKTNKEVKTLTDQAKFLGGTTAKSATEVLKLQTELARLGFSIREIKNSTPAILDLAVAFRQELGDAAAVSGGIIRAFGLDTKDTKEVVDSMTATLNNSGAAFEDYREAVSVAAPIFKAANIDFATMNLLIGKLADSQIKGSRAGTSLKNIVSKLADENSKLSKFLGFTVKSSDDLTKAFEILKTKNIDLTKATKLTDERSKAAFLTLIQGVDSADKLSVALNNLNDNAKKTADTMLDNLAGDVTLAQSAWESFVLSIEDGDGVISKAIRSIVQGISRLLSELKELNEFGKITTKAVRKASNEYIETFKKEIELRDARAKRILVGSEITKKEIELQNELNATNPFSSFLFNGETRNHIKWVVQQKNVIIAREKELFLLKKLQADESFFTFEKEKEIDVNEDLLKAGNKKAKAIKTELDLLKKRLELTLKQREALVEVEGITDTEQFDILTKQAEKINAQIEKIQMTLSLKELNEQFAVTAEAEIRFAKETIKNEDRLKIAILKIRENQFKQELKMLQKMVMSKKDLTEVDRKNIFDAAKRLRDVQNKLNNEDLINFTENQKLKLETFKVGQNEILLASDNRIEQEKQNELELKIFKIEQLVEYIEFVKLAQTDLTKSQKKALENTLLGLKIELAKAKDDLAGGDDFRTKLMQFLGVDEEGLTQIENNFAKLIDAARQFYSQITQAQIDAADKQINITDSLIENKQRQIDAERKLDEEGKANNLKRRQEELQDLNKLRNANLRDLEKAQKNQQRINDAAQISAIITAIANIVEGWSTVPFIGSLLGIAAAGVMLISFIGLKAQSRNLAEGEVDIKGPGTDKSDDIPANLSKGESVITAKGTKAGKNILRSLNKNASIEQMKRAFNADFGQSSLNNYISLQLDTKEQKKTNEYLRKLVSNQENQRVVLSTKDGYIEIKYKNDKLVSQKQHSL